MKFPEKLKYFRKNTKQRKQIQQIIEKLPQNEEICKQILFDLKNDHTKIVLDKDIKNSYYVFLNDTIYLCDNPKAQSIYARLILIAHECRHTLQSRVLQKLNFLFSNLELIAFIVFVIFGFLNKLDISFLLIYLFTVVVSIVPRLILEFDAVVHSIKIANQYMEGKLEETERSLVTNIYRFQVEMLFPIMLIPLFLGKIVRSGMLMIIFYFFN